MSSSKSRQETKVRFTFELAYDGGGLGKCGMDMLFVNGQKVVAAHIEQPRVLPSRRMKPAPLSQREDF
jgi:hypothetical protein